MVGAGVGYFSTQPVYRASGRVEVSLIPTSPTGPSAETDAAMSGRFFDAAVDRQINRLNGSDLVGAVTSSGEWSRAVAGRAGGVDAFQQRLGVVPVGDASSQIEVSFIDTDPRVAKAAVGLVLDAYAQSPAVKAQATMGRLIDQLVDERQQLSQKLDRTEDQIRRARESIGSVPLAQSQAAKLAQLKRVEERLAENRIALATIEREAIGSAVPPEDVESESSSDDAASGAVAARLGATELAELRQRKRELQGKLESLDNRMGQNAPAVIGLMFELSVIDRRIEKAESSEPVVELAVDGPSLSGTVLLDAAQLRERGRRLDQMKAGLEGDLAALAEQQAGLNALLGQVASVRRQIDDRGTRLNRLTRELPVRVRSRVLDDAVALPTVPVEDRRWAHAGIAGGGGLLVFGLLALAVALVDDRLRRPDREALANLDAPLVGTVPSIKASKATAVDSDLTALSIHEVRARLEAAIDTQGHKAFAITSAKAGSGKTSLTVGLASSLAMSGRRVLLVDCELAHRVNGFAAPHDDDAARDRQNLDDVMLDMGYLDPRDAELFHRPGMPGVGLVASLGGKPLGQCTLDTRVPGMALLPAIGARPQHIGQMSGRFVRRLVHEAIDFDVVLFDTGSVPGSVEALFVTAEVDGVLLVVSRGQSQRSIDHAMSQLRMVNARVIGTVFNRTAERDLTVRAYAPAGKAAKARASEEDTRRMKLLRQHGTGSGIFAAAIEAQATPVSTPAAEDAMEPSDAEETAADAGFESDDVSVDDAGDVAKLLEEELQWTEGLETRAETTGPNAEPQVIDSEPQDGSPVDGTVEQLDLDAVHQVDDAAASIMPPDEPALSAGSGDQQTPRSGLTDVTDSVVSEAIEVATSDAATHPAEPTVELELSADTIDRFLDNALTAAKRPRDKNDPSV